jgi:hypothetical protein
MRVNAAKVKKLGGSVKGYLPLGTVKRRSRLAVERALKNGYIATKGEGATLYHAIARQVGIPALSYSRASTWRASLTVADPKPHMIEGLKTWWTLDRVAYRLAKPEEYTKDAETDKRYTGQKWYVPRVSEPDWVKFTSRTQEYVAIASDKDSESLAPIVEGMRSIPGYEDRVQDALAMLRDNAVLEFDLER